MLSDIKYDDTCITLQLPSQMACGICKPKLDPMTPTRRSNKKQRHLSDRRRCQQYWLPKWRNNSSSYNKLNRIVCNYLGIESNNNLNNINNNYHVKKHMEPEEKNV